ncbi:MULTISPECIES: carbonate dehydratase [Gammaproteobacteria]|uniref:carbonate dehydratase n=1 Tax=Gammaproteobacteria TaxID=1236 RepID=UPI000DCFAC4C|nr:MULTISPECIES: carbonate dehydratase [Gammaproteobacteria]RTE87581.1 carbonate dehydratase [Aliidiomarina sp. B3213]TCZ92635.1 carbonate dehydratase [Lysobacter sp. N42]
MPKIRELLDNNVRWAGKKTDNDPEFFERLAAQQKPEYLWIGCADSRVPANEIVGMDPGELFVHRNIANQVIQTDFNCLAVVEYAVKQLKVKHILVVGHYGCGGVAASMGSSRHGIVDHWLHSIKGVYRKNESVLKDLPAPAKLDRMCELNVMQQVENLSQNHIIQEAWAEGQELAIHGWIYSIKNGLAHDLGVTVKGKSEVDPIYQYGDEAV